MVKKEIKNEIIDFEKKGNLIRFYLGENGGQRGHHWDIVPYEHNAGTVHDEFVKGYCDIVFDFDCGVEELCEALEVANTNYSKGDMEKRVIFCLSIIDTKSHVGHPIFFGNKIEDILKLRCSHLVQLVYKGGENK